MVGTDLYAQLIHVMPHGVLVWRLDESDEANPRLRLVTANLAANEALGSDLRLRLGETMREALPSVSAERALMYLEMARSGTSRDLGEVFYGDERVHQGWYQVRAFALPERSLGITFENITKRKAAAEELKRANAFLDSIVENIPNMVFVKDAAELRFERINRAGEELLGISREAMLGKNDYDFFPKDQADFFRAHDDTILRAGAVKDIPEEPIETARGRRWLHTKKIPILGEDGGARYLLGISEDITERKQDKEALQRAHDELERRVDERTAELVRTNEALRNRDEQLRQSQKMEAIGRLAGGVAHDFNNMLSVVMSYIDLLLGDLPPESSMREDLGQIKLAAGRAGELTHQLLAFSRQQILQPRALDLNSVVSEMDRMLRPLLGEDVELSKRLSDGLFSVHADPGQLQQVIMNLAVNARDAMPRGGKLTIETANVELDEDYAETHVGASAGPHVMLAVTDTGTGMDPEIQARIFEPFYTTKAAGKGTGLGLATVFGIVKQSLGNIWVYSEVGRGTTFKVYLPRMTEPLGAAAAAVVIARSPGGRETILLVEDEELVRRAARACLERSGYTVIAARSGEEALLECQRYGATIHLMITDVIMPRMSGRELAERLRPLRPEIKVLYMSGYTDNTIVHHGVLDASVQFLQKPFAPDVLARKVRDVLDA